MGEPTPPLPTTSAFFPCEVEALALHPADEAGAVELVAEQRAVLAQQHGVGRAGDPGGRRQLVDQLDRRDLVRHGHQRTADVGELEQVPEEVRVLLGLDAHRDDDGVDAVLVEPRVVDQRRLERERGITQVGDERGLPADHGRSSRRRLDARPMLVRAERRTDGPRTDASRPAERAGAGDLLHSDSARAARPGPPCSVNHADASQWAGRRDATMSRAVEERSVMTAQVATDRADETGGDRPEVSTVGVVGGGIMGSGIAEVSARAGCDVILLRGRATPPRTPRWRASASRSRGRRSRASSSAADREAARGPAAHRDRRRRARRPRPRDRGRRRGRGREGGDLPGARQGRAPGRPAGEQHVVDPDHEAGVRSRPSPSASSACTSSTRSRCCRSSSWCRAC